jgi:N-acetylmuramoyl-L-alanine amidase
MPKVCWDAGHGGYDPGAVECDIQEKDITLDIVLRGKPIAEENGIEVVLTRDGDYAPGHYENNLRAELAERCRIANDCNADLFISTHVNAGGGEGEELLVYHDGGNAEKSAEILLPLLTEVGGWYCRGVKEQNVEVLRQTNMQAVLTENGFIDSKVDTDRLKDPNFRQALAVAHVKGMCQIFGMPFSMKGGENGVKEVVVYFTAYDQSIALALANSRGGIGTFCRNGGASVHPDAMAAEVKYVVGGPALNCPGEVYLSGKDSFETIGVVVDSHRAGKV